MLRVEVGSGDLYGAEYAGKSQVLNVIMTSTSGVDGNVTVAGRRLWTGYINTDVAGSALIKRGASSINLSAGTGRNKQVEEGTDTITDADDGALREFRRKENSYFNRDPYLAGSWALERAQDNAFRANIRWAPSKFDLTQTNRVSPAEGAEHDDSLFQEFRNPVVELGGDITRPLAGGAIKFVGLATRRKRDDFEAYIGRDGLVEAGGEEVGGFEQFVNAQPQRDDRRVNWTRADLAGLSVEAGIEGALNTLDSAVDSMLSKRAASGLGSTFPSMKRQSRRNAGKPISSSANSCPPPFGSMAVSITNFRSSRFAETPKPTERSNS